MGDGSRERMRDSVDSMTQADLRREQTSIEANGCGLLYSVV